MALVKGVSYLPRALSDHSPMLLELSLGPKPGLRIWRMEASWLQEEYIKIKCTEAIKHFWAENGNSESSLLQWEAFKATLRGVFIAEVQGFKKQVAFVPQNLTLHNIGAYLNLATRMAGSWHTWRDRSMFRSILNQYMTPAELKYVTQLIS